MIGELAKFKQSFSDTSCTQARAKDVLVIWEIVRREEAVDRGVVTEMSVRLSMKAVSQYLLLDVVMQGIFVSAFDRLLYCPISPETLHGW